MFRNRASRSGTATHLVPVVALATGLALLSTIPGVPTRFVAIGVVAAAAISRGGLGRRMASSAFGRAVS